MNRLALADGVMTGPAEGFRISLVDGLMNRVIAPNARATMQGDVKAPRWAAMGGEAPSETAALLERCAGGDAKAFRRLYEINSARLYGVALRITRNPPFASDAVHDAMLQVWRNADRYDPSRGNADGWLVSLVRYRALDLIRKHGRESTGLDIPEQADEDPDALTRMVESAEGAALRACLQEVEPQKRQLVILAFINGLTQSEVAAQVGQPLGTVKSTIRRALITLRGCLERPALKS